MIGQKESKTEFRITDDDGEHVKAIFISRSCGCTLPGCVYDELEIYEDGEHHDPHRVVLGRDISGYIYGLLEGSCTSKKLAA